MVVAVSSGDYSGQLPLPRFLAGAFQFPLFLQLGFPDKARIVSWSSSQIRRISALFSLSLLGAVSVQIMLATKLLHETGQCDDVPRVRQDLLLQLKAVLSTCNLPLGALFEYTQRCARSSRTSACET